MRKSPQPRKIVKQFVEAINTYYDWPYNIPEGSGEYLRLELPGLEGIASGARFSHGFAEVDVNFNEAKVTFTVLNLEAIDYHVRKQKKS